MSSHGSHPGVPRRGAGLRPLLCASAALVLSLGCSGSAKNGGPRHADPRDPGGARDSLPYVPKKLVLELGSERLPEAKPSPILAIMDKELRRSLARLKTETSPAPYFMAYTATDSDSVSISATLGGLTRSTAHRNRYLTVDLRVGSAKFDNTHFKERGWGGYGGNLPLEDDEAAIRVALWLATDRVYKTAAQELSRVKAKFTTSAKEEDPSDDFSSEPRIRIIAAPASLRIDRALWERRVKDASAVFRAHPALTSSGVSLKALSQTRYYISSDGTTLQVPTSRFQITVFAAVMAEDGMRFQRQEASYSQNQEGLPHGKELRALASKVVSDLMRLRKAPLAHPYQGPAIFKGRAAGVFFHEVFGHRMEGHRQKLERFDQTFTKKRGTLVMPSFLSVFDDPRLIRINGVPLNGHYQVDDEGVRPRRVDMVRDGVLRDFLMSRTPIKTHARSSGHGRRSYGMNAVARQANLVVDPSRVVSYGTLRKMLLREVRRQGMSFGLVFEDVSGGFTFTQRVMPQAFKVHPVMVYRVYADGRPDELVRGVDLVGTPLLALSRIKAAASNFETFNGMCGAESGWVPVSATAPSLLFSKIETQRKPTQKLRPPLLPPPPVAGPGALIRRVPELSLLGIGPRASLRREVWR